MNVFKAKFVQSALSADGTAQGIVTVASTTDYRIGARVNVGGTGVTSISCMVLDIPSATTLKLGPNTDLMGTSPNYQVADVSAFTVAKSSYVVQNEQILPGFGQGVLLTSPA